MGPYSTSYSLHRYNCIKNAGPDQERIQNERSPPRKHRKRGKDPGAHLGSPGRRIRSRSTATWFVVDAEEVLGAVAVLLPLVRPQPEAAAACAVVGGEDPAAALTGKTGSGCGVVVGERIWLWRGRAPPPRAAASAVRERDTERGPERERERGQRDRDDLGDAVEAVPESAAGSLTSPLKISSTACRSAQEKK